MRHGGKTGDAPVSRASQRSNPLARAPERDDNPNRVTDVVVVGSGASGLPAALRARNGSATVIIVEANSDIGGHAMMSGGSVALGGGTTHQKKYGIEDSPDQVYL